MNDEGLADAESYRVDGATGALTPLEVYTVGKRPPRCWRSLSAADARPLHRRRAAVDEQQRAGHVRGVVGGEKQDAGGDFIGRAVTPKQGALGGVIPVLLERPADRLNAFLVKGRVDGAG